MDTRSTSETSSFAPPIIFTSQDLRLPRWVNEPLPDLRAILSASEISRLTRRPRWLLLGLAAIGRFPKRRTHCGRPLGWHRADVIDWLTHNMEIDSGRSREERACRQKRPHQACLPLEVHSPKVKRGCVHRAHSATGEFA